MCHFVYLRKTFSRRALVSQGDMWFSGDITQVAAYETPASPPLEISSVTGVLDQHTSRQRSENMWWGYEYTVMRVWIHCDEGVNTLWWGREYTVMRVWIHCDEGVNTQWWGCEYTVMRVWMVREWGTVYEELYLFTVWRQEFWGEYVSVKPSCQSV